MKPSYLYKLFLYSEIILILLSASGADDQELIRISVGSTVTLQCKNASLENLTQITWSKEENNKFIQLYSYLHTRNQTHKSNNTLRLSWTPEEPFSLQMKILHTSDAGNYSCTLDGVNFQLHTKWHLVIFESSAIDWTPYLISIPIEIVLILVIGCICYKRCFIKTNQQEFIAQNGPSNRNSLAPNEVVSGSDFYERFNSIYNMSK
ncbi:hypothetical protein chiPu_0001832 [Chiloscyllium punctatum]|uniref:Ig-like domain-containing protein n=1 Tax=Chiloscyllium punctatum TaxID=137246 RepID=A0A401RZ70_CHIPU|nr:hypothetical protein [Chiloscyllium punctatum]